MVKPSTTLALRKVRQKKVVAETPAASSLVTQFSTLPLSGTWSRVAAISNSDMADYQKHGNAWKQQMRNAVASSINDAKFKTGYDYSVAMIDGFTRDNVFYIVLIVTRTK
jgi:hypothetical protein